jgi:selenocysteine lyase/cysteine desulfurase
MLEVRSHGISKNRAEFGPHNLIAYNRGRSDLSTRSPKDIYSMQRRRFIKSVALGVYSGSVINSNQDSSPTEILEIRTRLSNLRPDPESFWRFVQEQFPDQHNVLHLNCGSIGISPNLAIDAHKKLIQEIESNPYRQLFGGGIGSKLDDVRQLAAKFLHATRDEISITTNTTNGMNLVARGLRLNPGDEVLTTNHEHAGGLACWEYLAQRTGIKVICLKMPLSNPDEIVDAIARQISPRTRVLSFCHVDTITGDVLPVEAIAKLARNSNAFFLCDGAQAAGMMNVDVKKLGVDAYVTSGHKWMMGPKGTGLLYLNSDSREAVDALELSAGMNVYTAASGVQNVAAISALGPTIEFLECIGMENIESRVRHLNGRLTNQLKASPKLKRLTDVENIHSPGIATYALNNAPGTSHRIAEQLASEFGIYVKATQSTFGSVASRKTAREDYNALRFSTHIFNSTAQIDSAVERLTQLLS